MGKYTKTIEIKPPMPGQQILDAMYEVANGDDQYYSMGNPVMGVWKIVSAVRSPRQGILLQTEGRKPLNPTESYGKVCVTDGEFHAGNPEAAGLFAPKHDVDTFVGQLVTQLASRR